MLAALSAATIAALSIAQTEVHAQATGGDTLPLGSLVRVSLKRTDRVEIGKLADWRADTLVLRGAGRSRSNPRVIALSDVDLVARSTGRVRYVAGGMLIGALTAAALNTGVPADTPGGLVVTSHVLLAAIGGVTGFAIAGEPWKPMPLPTTFAMPPIGARVRLTLRRSGTRVVGTLADRTPDSLAVIPDGPLRTHRLAVADIGALDESAGRRRPVAKRAAQGAALGAVSTGLLLGARAVADPDFVSDLDYGGMLALEALVMTTGAVAGGVVGAVLGLGGTAEVWKPRGHPVHVLPELGSQGAGVRISIALSPGERR